MIERKFELTEDGQKVLYVLDGEIIAEIYLGDTYQELKIKSHRGFTETQDKSPPSLLAQTKTIKLKI